MNFWMNNWRVKREKTIVFCKLNIKDAFYTHTIDIDIDIYIYDKNNKNIYMFIYKKKF